MNKFKVGDMVQVVMAGSGICPEGIGKITEITETGGVYGLNKTPGVRIESIPNVKHNRIKDKSNPYDGWIGEESFKLIEHPENQELINNLNLKSVIAQIVKELKNVS